MEATVVGLPAHTKPLREAEGAHQHNEKMIRFEKAFENCVREKIRPSPNRVLQPALDSEPIRATKV